MEYSNINEYLKNRSSGDSSINFKITPTNKKDNELSNKIDQIFTILSRLEEKVDVIEKKIGSETPHNQATTNQQLNTVVFSNPIDYKMKEIKPQVFDTVEEKTLKAHLRKRRVESDGALLYKIYFENLPRNLFPIRIVRKSSIEYWLNDHWNEDMDGEYIKETLSKNLIASYTKVNRFSSSTLSEAVGTEFMKNQNYILSLRDKKYQTSLWDYLKKNYLY